ncbi:MAG TPA: hypothetical protein VJZ71_02175 [Phycisphaerae bacterium]|nr:hypothetical protein [Phycisphaerae bacterium]
MTKMLDRRELSSFMFNRPLIRWLPILACMPHLLLAPLSGNPVLLHDHDDHGLHVHIPLVPDAVGRTNGTTFLREAHRHSHDGSAPNELPNSSAIEESTSLLYFVVPVDIASPRRGDLIIKDAPIQIYAGTTNGIAPKPAWHPPDSRGCPLDHRAGNSLAMILSSSNALLI